ncbi:hypothetical protein [Paraburkholderia caballeronis]|uniref:hypothetical protein n=1 Tax=Paraburkholderia caballeronis TaxID=416943 RepID=UPI00141701E7|nr:hypothetical protein [Paraburkholderia caballeronis]
MSAGAARVVGANSAAVALTQSETAVRKDKRNGKVEKESGRMAARIGGKGKGNRMTVARF